MLEDHFGPLLIVALIVVLSIQVAGRWLGFGSQLVWTDELARIFFVWSIFFSLPLASKKGHLVYLKFSKKIWPKNLRPHLDYISSLLWGLTALGLTIIFARNVYLAWPYPQPSPILHIDQNVLSLAAPISFLMVFVRQAALLKKLPAQGER